MTTCLVKYVRGFNPPVVVVKIERGAAYVVPASMPWAGARVVRADDLRDEPRRAKL